MTRKCDKYTCMNEAHDGFAVRVLLGVDHADELVALRDKICAQRGLKPQGHKLQIFVSAADE